MEPKVGEGREGSSVGVEGESRTKQRVGLILKCSIIHQSRFE